MRESQEGSRGGWRQRTEANLRGNLKSWMEEGESQLDAED